MSKFRKLHNEFLCYQSQNLLKKDMPCPTLIDKMEPLFSDSPSMISERKTGYQYGHDVLHDCLGKDMA